ncbi:MAG: DUF6261 family protein [Tannerella sp.]|jgi:hypothetical protein|nr:DUF6261 family protein [Tannerella sp.]
MKILKVQLYYLRNEAHYQYFLLLLALFVTFPSVASLVTDLLNKLKALVDTEGQLVDAVKASGYTEELAEADRRLDRDIVGLNSAVDSALHHFDPDIREAARKVAIRLKSFRGAIESKPYEEEQAAVKILIADLNSNYKTEIATLNLGPWLTELAAAQAGFEQLFILRNNEQAAKLKAKVKDIRKQVDANYRQTVEQIDSYTVVNGDALTGQFITRLNQEITYFNEHNRHHLKTDIEKAAVAAIPDQIYAGKPVVLLPEVFYEGAELVFATDYEVSYKDNKAPGTALLTIHGKGTFNGQKQVSFNIIPPVGEL